MSGTRRRQKGTGSVWQDKKKSRLWHGEIQIGTYDNGKPKKKRVTGSSSKEVKEKLLQIQIDVATAEETIKNEEANLTIPQMALDIANEKKELNLIKDVTYNRTLGTIKILEKSSALSEVPISEITVKQLREFFAQNTNYSNSVLAKLYRQISSVLKKAVKRGIIPYNYCEDIPCPNSDKPTKKISALTVEEQKALIAALNKDNREPLRTMLLLSLFTGMRMGEICALSVEDYDTKKNIITVNKTITRDEKDRYVIGDTTKTEAGERKLTVTPAVAALLNAHLAKREKDKKLLFSRNGNIYTTNQVNGYYKRLIQRYNISADTLKYNQHQLRHTYATRCIESGMNAKVLQHKLGHNDISVTLNTYADVFSQFEDKEDEKLISYLEELNIKF